MASRRTGFVSPKTYHGRAPGVARAFFLVSRRVEWLALNANARYKEGVIRSFRDRETARVFERRPGKRFRAIAAVAKRKLDHLHAAAILSDLRAIPGGRFEALRGDRAGQYSIRVNDRWRICFRWTGEDAIDVEIVDYH